MGPPCPLIHGGKASTSPRCTPHGVGQKPKLSSQLGTPPPGEMTCLGSRSCESELAPEWGAHCLLATPGTAAWLTLGQTNLLLCSSLLCAGQDAVNSLHLSYQFWAASDSLVALTVSGISVEVSGQFILHALSAGTSTPFHCCKPSSTAGASKALSPNHLVLLWK